MSLLFITATKRFGSLRFTNSRLPTMSSARSFGIGDQLQSKKKVEEERYIREQERKFFEKKKNESDLKLVDDDLKVFQATVAPAMAEVQSLLQKTGDSISDEGLELLARWKLNMRYD